MSATLELFTYPAPDGGFDSDVRVVIGADSEPRFVASDLCDLLEVGRTHDVVRGLDDDEKGTETVRTLGGDQNVTVVTEAGMYGLILRSRKPEAKRIRRWVTHEVLPAIRKTGSYSTAPALTGAELFAHAVIEAKAMLAAKDQQIAVMAPKAEFYDDLMDADGAYSWQAAAGILGWGRNVMLRELRKLGVVQGNRLPYRRYAHHFKVVPGTYQHPKTGEQIPCATTHVRPSGLEFLRKKLAGAEAVS